MIHEGESNDHPEIQREGESVFAVANKTPAGRARPLYLNLHPHALAAPSAGKTLTLPVFVALAPHVCPVQSLEGVWSAARRSQQQYKSFWQ